MDALGSARAAARQRLTVLSPCRSFRYSLWRQWIGGKGVALVVCLNPSTADERMDDPTIRRCCAFAKSWGFQATCVANLFAIRATDPADMLLADDPVGPDNDAHLVALSEQADLVVGGWGNDGAHRGRAACVRALLPGLLCLKQNKSGEPSHPLYLRGSLRPTAPIAPIAPIAPRAHGIAD